MKGNEKDIPKFQEQVCKKSCVMCGKCIEEHQDNSWFLACPKYFNWKMGITTFVAEQLDWQRTHPEENEEKHKQLVERAKQWKAQTKKKFKSKS